MRKQLSAVWALSFITSPSEPVRHPRRFDEQNFSADRRPTQAGGDPVFFDGFGGLIEEPDGAEILRQRLGGEHHGAGNLAVAHQAPGGFAAEGSDLAFELADAGLAGVIMNHPPYRRIGDARVLARQSMLLELTGNQVALGDLELFGFSVTGQLNDLEPVPQGRVDGIQPVGRGEEQDPREVERQIQVMIGEGVGLRRPCPIRPGE